MCGRWSGILPGGQQPPRLLLSDLFTGLNRWPGDMNL
jgi:hypothetical protein